MKPVKRKIIGMLLLSFALCLLASCGKRKEASDQGQRVADAEAEAWEEASDAKAWEEASDAEAWEEASDAKAWEEASDAEVWGKYLSGEYERSQGKDTKSRLKEPVYEKGKSAYITEADIEKGTAFYQAQGMDPAEAKAAAEAYFRESEALYAKAVREGYSATKEEAAESVAALREEFSDGTLSEESREEMAAIIGQFGSEEDYWDYERQVYERILPVQKYVSDMERKYFENHPKASDDEWIDYFEEYKKELVEKENFQKQ